jgi:flagellar biosynthesis/type III secretory pathway M-ring protein FliF/YscJ
MDPNTIATPEPVPTPTPQGSETKKSNKTVYFVIGGVILLLALVVVILDITAPKQTTLQPTPTNQTDNSIKNNTDLTSVESTLDSSNIDLLGADLSQNDTDASQF